MKRILIIGMAGSGNLGDDLISHLLVNHLKDRWPKAEVGVLIGQERIPFEYRYPVRKLLAPRKHNWTEYRQRWRKLKAYIKNTDLLVIGGGGLLQDSHHPFTPHKWLRYLRGIDQSCSVWGLGLGVGPLEHLHNRFYLAKVLPQLDVLQVRDKGSQLLVHELRVDAIKSVDVVAGSAIRDTPFGVEVEKEECLGCNIRPWPGLPEEQVKHALLQKSRRGEAVRLFVFKYKDRSPGAAHEELRLANRLKRFLQKKGRDAAVFCYRREEMQQFVQAFSTVSRAIACRYHAHILWQKLEVPTVPVSYAPKVKWLYRERGVPTIAIDEPNGWCGPLNEVNIELGANYRLPSWKEVKSGSYRRKHSGPTATMAAFGLAREVYGLWHGVKWRALRWVRRFIL